MRSRHSTFGESNVLCAFMTWKFPNVSRRAAQSRSSSARVMNIYRPLVRSVFQTSKPVSVTRLGPTIQRL